MIQFSEQLRAVKELIESMGLSTKVELFSGSFEEADLDKIKIDGKKPHIFIGCGGGPVIQSSLRLEIEATFAVWVIAKSSMNNPSYPKEAMDKSIEIATKIKTFRGDVKTNTRLPVLQSIQELSSGLRNGTNFAIWQVVWTQTIALD